MADNTHLICASPRTGNTLLCDGLRGTFEAGRPQEYFDNRPHVDARYKARLKTDNDADYFDTVMAGTTTGNGVCGLKVHWHQRLTMERIVRNAHERALMQRPRSRWPTTRPSGSGPCGVSGCVAAITSRRRS